MVTKSKKTAAKKAVVKKAAKPAARKPVVKKPVVKPAKVAKPVAKPAKVAKPVAKPAKGALDRKPAPKGAHVSSRSSGLDGKTLERIRDLLIKMRERLTGQINALSDESLKYIDDSSSEDRTDDFDREFALNLVSTEQESVFEIDSALRRIREGVYGVCDLCGCVIERPRLQALPFARMCIKCQSASERGRTRFRPFGEALEQGVEQEVAEVVEPEENE